MAFPCWDEPTFRAAFEVTLDVPEGLVALSNMPEKSREKVGHRLCHLNWTMYANCDSWDLSD